jgi:hypothetical protein
MRTTNAAVWLWAPRIAGTAISIFFALFALDAFDGTPLLAALPGFLVHLLPSVLVLGAVVIGWRNPLIGAAALTALAVRYAIAVRWRPGWIAFIGGPLLIVAALFVVSARYAGGKEPSP